MNDPITQVPCDQLLKEFTALILVSDDNTLAFVDCLGFSYDDTFGWPSRWALDVLKHGVAVGASKELLRWLILSDFAKNEVEHDAKIVNAHIDKYHPLAVSEFALDPDIFRRRLVPDWITIK